MEKQRIELIDALRASAIFPMIVQHLCYDLCAFCGAPWYVFRNPVCDGIHYYCGILFVLLAGVSSNFSRSNILRGLKTLGAALALTLVTTLVGEPVVFGVLHLLGSCMLLYGLAQTLSRRVPRREGRAAAEKAAPVLCAGGILLTARFANGYPTTIPHLWIFGFVTPDFYSSDYFPLLPWIFVFLLGVWAGGIIRAGRFPRWFYEVKAPRLALVGRHSLLIYLVHQPVLYGLVMLGRLIFIRE